MSGDIWDEVKAEVIERLEAIAEYLEGRVADKVAKGVIYDTGEFFKQLEHEVVSDGDGDSYTVRVWSRVPYAKYIAGGKRPSWTPIEPLVGWVKRKKLSWVDKRTGDRLSVTQMAYMIRCKIKREGIRERNVFEEVMRDELDNIKKMLSDKIGGE
jgi:hypothetical protein